MGLNGREVDQKEFWDKYPLLKKSLEIHNSGLFKENGLNVMLRKASKLGDAWAANLEKKWELYQEKELELQLNQLELRIELNKKDMPKIN